MLNCHHHNNQDCIHIFRYLEFSIIGDRIWCMLYFLSSIPGTNCRTWNKQDHQTHNKMPNKYIINPREFCSNQSRIECNYFD